MAFWKSARAASGVPGARVDHPERDPGAGEQVVLSQGALAVPLREGHELGPLLVLVEAPVRLSEAGVGQGVAGVLLESAIEEGDGPLEAPGLLVPLEGAAALGVGRVAEGLGGEGGGLGHARRGGAEGGGLLRPELQLEHVDDCLHQVLGAVRRHRAQRAVAVGVLEGGGEQEAAAEPLDAAGDHQGDPEGARGPFGARHPGLQHVARGLDPERALEALELGEAHGEQVDDALGQGLVLRARPRRAEREDGDVLLGGDRPQAQGHRDPVERRRPEPRRGRDERRGHDAEDGDPSAARREGTADAGRRGADRGHLGEVLAQASHLAREVEGRGVALGRVLGKATLDHPAQGPGQGGGERRQRLGRVVDDRGDRLGRRLAAERLAARRHLVQDRPERELVRAVVDGAAARLLRGHVAGRPEHDPGRGLRRGRLGPGGRGRVEPVLLSAGAVAAQLGEAEVEDLDVAVGGHHDVLGLQVPVDDAGGVGLGEAVRDLGSDVEQPSNGQGARILGQDQLAQRVPLDHLHHDVGQAGGLADVVDGDDVGVVERGGGPGLLREAAHAARVGGELLGQELDGEVAVEVVVARAPDLSHPPCAEAGKKLVLAETHPC